MTEARKKYGDIIDHPHFVSPEHPPMALENRAAQFSPFAALTGYDDLVAEAARYTVKTVNFSFKKSVASFAFEPVAFGKFHLFDLL